MTGIIIIPFRQGSKGLPDKPFQKLGDQTLLQRTVAQAAALKVPVVLYTDYKVVPGLEHSGVRVVSRDPVDDKQTTEEAMRLCLEKYANTWGWPDVAALMPCNTPVKLASKLAECWQRMEEDYPAVDSVTLAEPIQQQAWERWWSGWRRVTSGTYGSRQTKPPELYLERSGVFCVSKTSVWLKGQRLGKIVEKVICRHPWLSLDIHTRGDLDLANWLLKRGELS